MKKFIITMAAAALTFGFNLNAEAITLDGQRINFDDLTPAGSVTPLGTYLGFDWDNFFLYKVPSTATGTGYGNGLLSPPHEIYSWSIYEQTITKTAPGETFSFTEIWATASLNNLNLELSLEGKLAGNVVFSDLIALSTSGPEYRDYTGTAFENIDELHLKGLVNGVGYAQNPNIGPVQYQYVLDSPGSPVPEPSSILLGLAGISGLFGSRRKKA